MRNPVKWLGLLAALLSASGTASAQTQPATVILVRHAEKAAEPADDPPLSAVGRERAEALLDAVRDAHVDVIYSTQRRRNMETAQFVANALQVPIVQTPIESRKVDAYIMDVVRRVRQQGGGRVTLIIGHSNTLKPMIKALGGPEILEVPESQYDNLFVLTTRTGMPAKLVRAKYGRRSEGG